MPANALTFQDGRTWRPDRESAGTDRVARRPRTMRYSPDLSRTVAFAQEPRTAGLPVAEPYRGLATISSRDVASVQVQVCLVAGREGRTGLPLWWGRVVAEDHGSLLGFADSDSVQLHIAGHTANMTITSLGEAASEIAGCGEPPF
jgi:hypothetical protein